MTIPTHPVTLMKTVYKNIFPYVHQELTKWRKRAESIPNQELRRQALASIEEKAFHSEGGAIMAMTAEKQTLKVIRFIVAYQTMSDYLDNLCDRSTSLDPKDFAALHEAMEDALMVETHPRDYYRYRLDQNDGGYLTALVTTCQHILKTINDYPKIRRHLWRLCHYYCELQIHKHVHKEEREQRLIQWFHDEQQVVPSMNWYEFSACTGSTLGIFCLVAYATRDDFNETAANQIVAGYFPYIQGLHILLDYLIDQQEDRIGGDLNFCFYYEHPLQLKQRLLYFYKHAEAQAKLMPNASFHQQIVQGLLGLYLSDRKVDEQRDVKKIAKQLLKQGGKTTAFFYWNGRMYRKFQRLKNKVK